MSRWLDALWYPKGEAARAPAAARPLKLASAGFGAGVRLRNALYDRGVLEAVRVSGAFVVSVGNLNVGGAGKTPAVLFLADWARRAGRRVAVLSRGYGREVLEDRVVRGGDLPPTREVGDEPRMLAARLGDVPVLVGADRARLAQRARAQFDSDFLVLDDGLQHRQLFRDADLVVVDEALGFGNGQLLPYGPLREPPEALRRATVIWLREASTPRPLALPAEKVVRCRHEARLLVDPEGRVCPAALLAGVKVLAVAGIAHPAGFVAALGEAGAEVCHQRLFADHHPFSADELAELRALARRDGCRLVTTEKDLQRLPRDLSAWALRVEVRVVRGLERLAAAVGLEARFAPDRPPAPVASPQV